MKKLFPVFMLVSLIYSCESSPKSNQTSSGIFETINKEDFLKKMEEKSDKILIDVRTPEEFQGGTISSAININFYDKNFDAEISKLDKSKPIFVFCKSGGRSGKALSKMKTMEFKEVYDLAEGYLGWKK